VLDVFCADGGFGLHAAYAGAAHVHFLDASDDALDRVRRNAEIGGVTDRISAESADALDRLGELAEQGADYDLIVLDPPGFAQSRRHVEAATKAYQRINISALRMLPLAEFQKYSPDVRPTFRGSEQVLAVLQYWLNEVKVIEDVYDPSRFAADPVYARHIGQLNILTFLIEHGDSNAGNFLISRAPQGARVFSIDHGVAFAHNESDRGELWKVLRVDRLPADAVQRLRTLTEQDLESRLAVLAQWQLRDGQYVAVPPAGNVAKFRGVRLEDDVVQLGLTGNELRRIWRQRERLLKEVDNGKITTF
jgi:predicted RNA methylase